jgi:hypothetical protein
MPLMKPVTFFLLLAVSIGANAAAQSITVFAGIPSVKISEGGTERLPETLTRLQAANIHCVISKIGDDYFWASRENKPLVLIEGVAFNTFVAADGSGYIRVTIPAMKKTAAVMSGAEAEFDYVEHLLIGLRSVTYYGKIR